MPVQINEIVITATVSEPSQNRATNNNNNSTTTEIVKTCVEEVLRILQEKQER